MNATIFPDTENLTFADFFKLAAEVEDILGSFGYSYRFQSCVFERHEIDRERRAVSILAIGVKEGNRLWIGGQEVSR